MSLNWISYTLCKYMHLTVGRDAGALLVVGQFITILKSQITTSNQAAAGSPHCSGVTEPNTNTISPKFMKTSLVSSELSPPHPPSPCSTCPNYFRSAGGSSYHSLTLSVYLYLSYIQYIISYRKVRYFHMEEFIVLHNAENSNLCRKQFILEISQ